MKDLVLTLEKIEDLVDSLDKKFPEGTQEHYRQALLLAAAKSVVETLSKHAKEIG